MTGYRDALGNGSYTLVKAVMHRVLLLVSDEMLTLWSFLDARISMFLSLGLERALNQIPAC